MPLDGLTLGFVARELHQTLAGARVERVTQPERDMLLIFLRNNGRNYRLLLSASPSLARAHLTLAQFVNPAQAPMFCMLMRKHLTGGRLSAVAQLNGDRVLRLDIDTRDELGEARACALYLEAMGRHSNLTLVQGGRIIDAIRHVTDDMSRVRQALPGLPYVPPPAQDKLDPAFADENALLLRLSALSGRLDKALSQTVTGLSATAARELCFRLTGGEQTPLSACDLPALCARLSDFLRRLPFMSPPVLLTDDNGMPADVFPFAYLTYPARSQKPQEGISPALDAYFTGRDSRERMKQRAAGLRRLLRTHVERAEKKLSLQEEELLGARGMEDYRVMGELLTAQLHLVPRGAASVTLDNYYTGQPMEIPLDVRYTPAQNAQRYFRRYSKARSALRLAAQQKEKTLAELALLEGALCDLDACQTPEDIGDIRAVLAQHGILKKEGAAKGQKGGRPSRPMRLTAPGGLSVSVGKNALQNERLTQAARGEDIWLHAKDMPGSHVILHTQEGDAPDDALLFAARFAAFYSKARGVSAPVDYTRRKHVKKASGAPPGHVVYTRQRTLIVDVSEAEIRRLERDHAPAEG